MVIALRWYVVIVGLALTVAPALILPRVALRGADDHFQWLVRQETASRVETIGEMTASNLEALYDSQSSDVVISDYLTGLGAKLGVRLRVVDDTGAVLADSASEPAEDRLNVEALPELGAALEGRRESRIAPGEDSTLAMHIGIPLATKSDRPRVLLLTTPMIHSGKHMLMLRAALRRWRWAWLVVGLLVALGAGALVDRQFGRLRAWEGAEAAIESARASGAPLRFKEAVLADASLEELGRSSQVSAADAKEGVRQLTSRLLPGIDDAVTRLGAWTDDDSAPADVVREVHSRVATAQRLLHDVETVMAGDAATSAPHVETLMPAAVVDEVARRHLRLAASRGVEVITDVDVDCHLIVGRRGELIDALSRVVENAILYQTESPAPVRIEAWNDGDEVNIKVIDRGRGISPAMLERVGEPFLGNDASDELPAGGMGLAVARVLIARHRGRLTVQSRVGVGTAVTLAIPRHQGAGEDEDPSATSGETGKTNC